MARVQLVASAASLLIAALPLGAFAASNAKSAHVASATSLDVAAESSTMIWNAVAVDGNRVFVSGPRWAGSKGPPVALLDSQGRPQPYPDEDWNSWRPGEDATMAFVNVNAIHRDDHGGLWVVDTGAPNFGGDPIAGAAKAVRIDLRTDHVDRVYRFDPDTALPGSYIDDIRFHRDNAYLSDAGRAGLIVLDLRTGVARRVLEGTQAVTAPTDRPILIDGQVLAAPDGTPLRVNSDPLEVSPDARYLYFGTLHGPWSRIETRFLDDESLQPDRLDAHIEPWANLPPTGGTAMAADGTLFFSELSTNSLKQRAPDGAITTVVQDPRLHWADAPAIADGWVWLPVPQLDRVALFNGGTSKVQWPVRLYRYPIAKMAER